MQALIKFKQFVDEILADNSRNAKIAVLTKYKDDEDVKYLLDFVYNPYITTGISKKSYQRFHNNSCIDTYPKNIFGTTKEALEYLKVHNTGDYNTRELMFSYYMAVHLRAIMDRLTGLHELFYNIITKNIQLGIDSKTINKVIPSLIPEFNVQLANKYFDKPEVVEGKEFALTTKIDGSRIVAMKDNGQVSFWTRQGQPYEGLVDLEKELRECFPDNICLDGEIVAIDTDLESTYKNTMKLSRTKDQEKHGLKMLVFDCMSVEDFKNQKCTKPYFIRRADLLAYFSHCCTEDCIEATKEFDKNNLPNYPYYPKDGNEYMACTRRLRAHLVGFVNNKHTYFKMLPILYQGSDTNKILEILDEQVNAGQEGIMINIVNAPYEFRRTNTLLKVKKFQDTEVKIVGFEEGTNKLAGTLGAFVCEYKNNKVRVGSGLSEEDRAYFWANKDKYLGKYITVKYFEESYDSKTKLPSLRFPIYLRVREDM